MDDYYPFGLTFNSYSRENSTPNDYKYNSKEEQTELGLGWLDYGWRMFDPSIGRWNANLTGRSLPLVHWRECCELGCGLLTRASISLDALSICICLTLSYF